MKKLRVYGGRLRNPNPPLDRPPHKREERVVCAVTSQKELKEIVDKIDGVGRVSLGYIRACWCITGNTEEIHLALANPHQIIWTGKT